MPVRDREERCCAKGRCEPHADEKWSSSEAIGREADGDEACSGDDIADEEHEADVRGRRPEILEEQRKEGAQKTEPDPPEDLGDGEGAGLLAEA
jgi:hypothetical protein